ncbi:MAG: hypothetical protein JW910_10720 [Anaerolineae bacterium]|nr:hypothetical protein [Anaerolineae bacterium]
MQTMNGMSLSLLQMAGLWITLGGVFVGYVGLVAGLTTLRRRNGFIYAAAVPVRVSSPAEPRTRQYARPLTEQWQLQTQASVPDDVNILIRPDEATLRRMALRRAIDYLEEAS